ncbi:pilin [Acinetobacter nosocomialis]
MTRSKVTELVTAADACKTSVAEFYQSKNALPNSLTQSGCSTNTTQYIASLDVDSSGTIKVTGTTAMQTAMGATTPPVFALKPTADTDATKPLSWTCTSTAGTTIPSKFLPANCRGS